MSFVLNKASLLFVSFWTSILLYYMVLPYFKYLNEMWRCNYCMFCVKLGETLGSWFVCVLKVQEKDVGSHEDSPDEC